VDFHILTWKVDLFSPTHLHFYFVHASSLLEVNIHVIFFMKMHSNNKYNISRYYSKTLLGVEIRVHNRKPNHKIQKNILRIYAQDPNDS
jgi:hypothetical protein